MTKLYKTFNVQSKAVDPELGIYEAMISTEDVDRDGDILVASGVQLENYLKNPVVLFGHWYHNPQYVVGKAINVEVLPKKGIKAQFQFADRETSEDADLVRRLWAGGFLNATSVGFIPHAREERETEEGEKLRRGWLFTEWELLEFSIVPIPANQNALRLAAKAMDQTDNVIGSLMEESGNAQFYQTGGFIETEAGRVSITGHPPSVNNYFLDPTIHAADIQDRIDELAKTTIPYRDEGTADEGESWSRPRLGSFTEEAFDSLTDAEKRRIARHYTWAASLPPENFGAMKLPHHRAATSGVGPAVWRGVAAAMAALLGARGGADIPDGDRRSVYNHLAKHYAQFDKEPPEFRAYSEEEIKSLFDDEPDPEEDTSESNTNDPPHDANDDLSPEELEAISDYLDALSETLTGNGGTNNA